MTHPFEQIANELNYFSGIQAQYTKGTFSVRPAYIKPMLKSIVSGEDGRWVDYRMIEDDLYGVYETDDDELNYIFIGSEGEAMEFAYQTLRERGLVR